MHSSLFYFWKVFAFTGTPGVDSPCSPVQQVRGGISPNRGNASKIQASLPQATIEQNRRELVAFCQQCWQFTNFRRNKGEIGILPSMVRLLIDTYRTAEHQPGRLREELTSQEIKKYVAMCLKPGKSTGPDRCPNEPCDSQKRWQTRSSKLWKCGWIFFWQKTQVDSEQRWTAPFRSFTKLEARIKRRTNDQ